MRSIEPATMTMPTSQPLPPEAARIPYAKPHLWGNDIARLREVVDAGWLSSHGEIVGRFEQQFAAAVDARFAVATTSGTSALHLAMTAIGIQPGDEVIVPDFTMISPIFAVRYCGA